MNKTIMLVLIGMMVTPFVMAQDLTGEWVSVETWGVKNGQGQHRLSNPKSRWIDRCEIDEEQPANLDPDDGILRRIELGPRPRTSTAMA